MRNNHAALLTSALSCAFSLVDQAKTGRVGASSLPRTAANANQVMLVPPRAGRPPFRSRSYWLAALCLVAVPVQGMGQDVQQGPAPFSQEGSKLVGTEPSGHATQGWSVALSADGNTAIVGGVADNRVTGAAWIYTRSAATSTQQGSKLVGTGVIGIMGAGEGFSVALSADGNTAIVGGPYDNTNAGAAWVFTRNGAAWTQQGDKLVGTGAVGNAEQGWSVALSADGNTAIVGGLADDRVTGAAWVFTRNGDVWSQQGGKLVGRDAVGSARQGHAVALSADGNIAIVGGPHDDAKTGAAWIYSRNGMVWNQIGNKLVGTGPVGNAEQGSSVALSADGNIALVGANTDDADRGAAWVFARRGNAWTQQGNKLVGSDAVGTARQGRSVALSADGSTAIVGGLGDDSEAGAAWVFTRSGAAWTQQGNKLVGTGAVGNARQGRSVALSADGRTAIVGGLGDDGMTGAAWVFTRSGNVWNAPTERLGF
jgi:antibiotic biosynthesis monooxygenase (ABM) superfamily enzyme